MSETREQFRERIRGVVERAFATPPVDAEEASDRCYWPSVRDRENAAEAVYAQALRDVWDAMVPFFRGETDEFDMDQFAAEKGIDLKDEA